MSHLWKLVGLLVVGLFVFTLFFGDLYGMIEQLLAALLNLRGPYAQAAVDSSQAMSYALSCTALMHSYNPPCSQYSGTAQDECNEIETMFTDGPATPKIPQSCEVATDKNGMSFGAASVTCDGLSAGNSGGCEIHGFTLPQEIDKQNIGEEALSFIIGNGHPKYLVYYEAFGPKQATEWESRLEGTSAFALASGAFISGVTAAALWGGTGGVAVARSGGDEAAEGVMRIVADRIPTGWFEDGIASIRGSIDTIPMPSGPKQHVDDALGKLKNRIKFMLGGLKQGIVARSEILMRNTEQIPTLDHRVGFLTGLRKNTQLADDEVPDAMRKYWIEGTDDVAGVRQLVDEKGALVTRDEIRDRMRVIRDDIPVGDPIRLADNRIDDISFQMKRGIQAADDGADVARTIEMDPSMYWRVSTAVSVRGDNFLRAADEYSQSFLNSYYGDKMRSGYRILKHVPSAVRPRVVARADSAICGARPLTLAASSQAFADVVQSEFSQDEVEERWIASSLSSAGVGGNTIVQAVRSACGNGKSAVQAIAAAAGTATALGVAAVAVQAQREINMGLSKTPQGMGSVNQIVLKRPYTAPREFPLNKYANWWYMNLDPKQEVTGIDPKGRRLMLASPCWAVPKNDDDPSYIALEADKIGAMFRPAGNFMGPKTRIQKGNSKDNTCHVGPYGTCQGDVTNCAAIEQQNVCTGVGCTWTDGSCTKASSDSPSCGGLSSSLCGGDNEASDSEYLGLNEIEQKTWSNTVAGSYKVTDAVGSTFIVYTHRPIVHPKPGEDASWTPPGNESNFHTKVFGRAVKDPTYDEGYWDQRGYWTSSGANIPKRFITADGRAVKTITRQTWATIFNDINPISREKQYQLRAITAEFQNTKFQNTEEGPNYCYARMDWDAFAAKSAILGGSFALETLIDTGQLLTAVPSGGASIVVGSGLQFLIGVGEHVMWWGAEEFFAERWPR